MNGLPTFAAAARAAARAADELLPFAERLLPAADARSPLTEPPVARWRADGGAAAG